MFVNCASSSLDRAIGNPSRRQAAPLKVRATLHEGASAGDVDAPWGKNEVRYYPVWVSRRCLLNRYVHWSTLQEMGVMGFKSGV